MCTFQADLDVTAPDMEFAEEMSMLQPLVRDGLVDIEGRAVYGDRWPGGADYCGGVRSHTERRGALRKAV